MPLIAQISDLHLQSAVPERQAQVEPILEKVNELKPDLVVISGDITDDGWDSIDELKWAKGWLDERIEDEWLALPGNHDVGNFFSMEKGPISQPRIDAWNQIFNPVPVYCLDSWWIQGINSMVFGSNLEAYPISALADLPMYGMQAKYRAIFLHSPQFIERPDESTSAEVDYWLGSAIGREGAWVAIEAMAPRLIGSGHVHQARLTTLGDMHIAWAPPASGTWVHAPGLPNPPMPTRTGFLLHDLGDDGSVSSELIECAPMLKLYHHTP